MHRSKCHKIIHESEENDGEGFGVSYWLHWELKANPVQRHGI